MSPVVEVFEEARHAIVNISATHIIQMDPRSPFDRMFEDLFEFPAAPRMRREVMTTSVGSGFVIHDSGYVVTNAHVVARTADRRVIFSDGREFAAEIVAMNTDNDLAVLKIEANTPLTALPFGRSDDLMVGETVIAIGNPLGLQTTLTTGVVSALDRTMEVRDRPALEGLIQTDAAINSGNSGGPLLNILGELVGVTTAIRADAQNVGFAIPVDRLSGQLPRMLAVERRYRIETGMTVEGLDGPEVTHVALAGPAAQAGLMVGDLIVACDGRTLSKTVDFHIALIGRGPGDRIQLQFERSGRRFQTWLMLGEKPKPDGARLTNVKLGIELEPLAAALAVKLGIPKNRGLMVTKVDPNGPASGSGLEPADIMVQIDGQAVATLEDMGLFLEDTPAGTSVSVTVLRLTRGAIFGFTRQVRLR